MFAVARQRAVGVLGGYGSWIFWRRACARTRRSARVGVGGTDGARAARRRQTRAQAAGRHNDRPAVSYNDSTNNNNSDSNLRATKRTARARQGAAGWLAGRLLGWCPPDWPRRVPPRRQTGPPLRTADAADCKCKRAQRGRDVGPTSRSRVRGQILSPEARAGGHRQICTNGDFISGAAGRKRRENGPPKRRARKSVSLTVCSSGSRDTRAGSHKRGPNPTTRRTATLRLNRLESRR